MNKSVQKNAASLQNKDKDTQAASSQGASLGPSVRFSIMISRWNLAHSHMISSALYSPRHQAVQHNLAQNFTHWSAWSNPFLCGH